MAAAAAGIVDVLADERSGDVVRDERGDGQTNQNRQDDREASPRAGEPAIRPPPFSTPARFPSPPRERRRG